MLAEGSADRIKGSGRGTSPCGNLARMPPTIGFFGLPLAALLLMRDGHQIQFAVLSPVAAVGRRRLRAALPENRVVDLLDNDLGFEQRVDALFDEATPDLIISWYYTRLLPERWLARKRLDALGVHPSLLPRHRGPNPFFWAIDQGDVETGVSVHKLQSEYDTGPVLAQRRISVEQRDAWQLARALDRPSLLAMREVVCDYANGRVRAAKDQNPNQATFAPEPTGHLLRVQWNWPTERIVRRIRALSPVPGLALKLHGRRLCVTRAGPTAEYPEALLPGEASIGERLVLRTGDGAIAVERAQLDARDLRPGEGDCSGEAYVVAGERLACLLRTRSSPARRR
jgi:methionyl-tRNA formyltransferase